MFAVAAFLAAAPIVVAVYAYVGYPLILLLASTVRRRKEVAEQAIDWPSVTITVPIYNAAASIRSTLERLLELDYPREKLQILVISDASTDGTDEIVRSMSNRGIEMLRLPVRRGKTAAENAS